MKSKFQPSERLSNVSESITLRLNALAQQMRADGQDVINLTVGEPDSPVPENIKNAAKQAIDQNRSKYTPAAGIPELRAKIAQATNVAQPSLATPWSAKNVVVTAGAKQALFNAFMALVNPGDEVVLFAPYWGTYLELIHLCQGVPVIIDTRSNHWRVDAEALKKSVTSRTKLIVLNSPSNPTGLVASREELGAIDSVLKEICYYQNGWVISDEIYEHIVYAPHKFVSFAEVASQNALRVITVNGLSKSVSLTGWRVGWSVADESLTASMNALQAQSTSGVNSVAQYASLAAFDLSSKYYSEQLANYDRRRQIVIETLTRCSKLILAPVEGAFFGFFDVLLPEGQTSSTFCERILKECLVAVMPGEPFGAEGTIRMSFATDDISLRKGCERIVEFLDRNC